MTDANELRAAARHAYEIETIVSDVAAILDAISAGGMLDQLPEDKEAALRHNSAVCLLHLAARRLAEEETIEGTDLSIKLRVMADDLHLAKAA